jgi:tRNA (guanine-N7-)-methyltransferase
MPEGAFDGGGGVTYVCAPMSDPASDSAREQANARAAEIARRYREEAPRAPEGGLSLFEIFPANAEIEMEIGFGRGQFLQQRTVAAPGAYLLGLEIKKKLVYQVAQRFERMQLSRVRVMSGDVRAVLPGIQPEAALARVFMSFPDPWWKKRHAKRRLFSAELIGQVARVLRPGGELFVQTDVEERMQEGLADLREHPAFELPDGGILDHNPFGAQSNRETRAIEDGLPVYRILARKR